MNSGFWLGAFLIFWAVLIVWNQARRWAGSHPDLHWLTKLLARLMAVLLLVWMLYEPARTPIGVFEALALALVFLKAVSLEIGRVRERQDIQQRIERHDAEMAARYGRTGKVCSSCRRPVPASTQPGDSCPYCNALFYRETPG
jgi:hypothetical protein